MSVTGLFFPEQILTPQGLGAFGAGAVSDGVLDGCDITASGSSASMAAGWISCGGRVFNTTAESFALSGAYSVIYAKVDTSQASTETEFAQATVGVESAADAAAAVAIIAGTNASFPQDDINLAGTVKTVWLAVVENATGTVTVNRCTARRGMVKLWENAAPAETFPEQTLTLPAIAGFNAFLITTRRNTQSVEAAAFENSFLCVVRSTGQGFTLSEFVIADTANGNNTTLRQRNVRIDRAAGTMLITAAWTKTWSQSGYSVANGSLIPTAIYGFNVG